MRSYSSFGAEIKKLLASQNRDQFPVGPGRAVPGRELVLWKNMFVFLFFSVFYNNKKPFFFLFFVFFCFFFFLIFYQSYNCVVSPYFVKRVYFSTHNNTHNHEKSSDFQNQKFIDETVHIKVISQIWTNLHMKPITYDNRFKSPKYHLQTLGLACNQL